MHAANRGSNNGRCRPPTPTQIDWIFGARQVRSSTYQALRNDQVRWTTDHPLVVATLAAAGSAPVSDFFLTSVRTGAGEVASRAMMVRIGSAVDGSPVSVDTATTSVLALVGDPGRGKTTVARYLARWWIADPVRAARIFAEHPHQYADLQVEVRPLVDAHSAAVAVDGRELTIIDGADSVAIEAVCAHAHAPGLTILTSFGEAAQAFAGTGNLCLGLLARQIEQGLRPAAWRHETDAAQGRLDWPSDVVAVVPDARGERDFPVHRWQVVGRAAG